MSDTPSGAQVPAGHASKSEVTRPEDAPGGFRFAAATFIVVGAASTLAQIVAVASLGLPVTWEWSTGGLIAAIAAIWMWVKCRSWAAWRKWVWLPVGVTVVVAFVTINLMVASARETAEREAAEEHARTCSSAQRELRELVASHEALVTDTWAYEQNPFAMREGWVPSPPSDGGRDWSMFDEIAGVPTQAEVWNFYESRGGPEMESDIAALESGYNAECGR